MIDPNVELMNLRLISLFLGAVVAVAPIAWGEPADQAAPTTKNVKAKAEKSGEKRGGFFGLFKRKSEKTKPAVDEVKEEGDSSDRRRKTFVTKSDRVPFYRWGPIQPGGPDRFLGDELLVVVVKEDGEWTEIRLDNGETGVVASDELRKAKASDFPVPIVKKKPKAKPSKSVVVFENVPAPPLPELEAFDLGDLELPPLIDVTDNPLLFPPVLPEDLPE